MSLCRTPHVQLAWLHVAGWCRRSSSSAASAQLEPPLRAGLLVKRLSLLGDQELGDSWGRIQFRLNRSSPCLISDSLPSVSGMQVA